MARSSFPLFALTQAFSILGSRMTGVAMGFAVYSSTGKTAALLGFALCSELPSMVAGSAAGLAVDRMEGRLACALGDAGQALGSLALVLVFLSGRFEPWMLYALGLWQGLFGMVQGPAKDSLVARLIPDAGRDRVNAILSFSFPAAGIVAPALAGAVYALGGIGGVVAVDLATFVVASAAVLFLPPCPPQGGRGPEEGGLGTQLSELFACLRARPGLGLLIAYATILNFCLNGPLELAQPYALAVTGSAAAAGLALSLQGGGGAVGSALLALRGRPRSRIRLVFLGMAGAGLCMLAAAGARSVPALGLSLFGVVACLQVWSLITTILQSAAPPSLQGRLSAFSGQLGYLGATASFALVGPLVDRVLGPARLGSAWWSLVEPLVGEGQGASMGLALAAGGFLVLAASAVFFPLLARRGLD